MAEAGEEMRAKADKSGAYKRNEKETPICEADEVVIKQRADVGLPRKR